MSLSVGDPAPHFIASTPTHAVFRFDNMAGRYVVLAFLPSDAASSDYTDVIAATSKHKKSLDDAHASFFGVLRAPAAIAGASNSLPGVRWFLDQDRAIFSRLQMLDGDRECSGCLVLDPSLRVLRTGALADLEDLLTWVARQEPPGGHAGASLHAPSLLLPRVFEPEFCRELISMYEEKGGAPSGFMTDVGGRTVLMEDDFYKRRRDAMITAPPMLRAVRERIIRRIFPEVKKAFAFEAADIERYLVACYDASERGFFRAHRDNTTELTAHRQFAVTINLNAEEYEGGDLRFPEFGDRTYRAPTGGAIVFACSLLHEVGVVTRGKRYACLPFLYDAAGVAAVKARSNHQGGKAAPEEAT